jgi:hypothetical protein
MQNFKTLRQPLLGELAMSWRKRREEKKIPFIVATYVYASSQGQRTHSARTKMKKKCITHNEFMNVGYYPGFYSSLRGQK